MRVEDEQNKKIEKIWEEIEKKIKFIKENRNKKKFIIFF